MTEHWKHFPLLPFLAGIRQDFDLGVADYERLLCVLQAGEDWTMPRLEHVLCALFARSPEQVERFHRAFQAFFVVSDVRIEPAVVQEWIAALRAEAKSEAVARAEVVADARPRRAQVGRSRTSTDSHGRRRIGWLLLTLFVLLSVWQFQPQPEPQITPPATPVTTQPSVTPTPPPVATPARAVRLYTHAPEITAVATAPLPRPVSWWRWWAGGALLLLLTTLGFGLYLRRLQRPPRDHAPVIDEQAPAFFSRRGIGGSLPARISPADMAAMADAMGYFNSDQPDRRLDVDASIHATLRQGGVVDCRFLRRQRMRRLLILQDERADAVAWNSIAAELAAGMAHHGVPVTFGRYRGDPSHFVTAEGESVYLEDLEDQRQGQLLLLFSDGLQFHRSSVQRTLEQLAHWPMVAWLDLRLPAYQREGVSFAEKLKLPRYDATASGILAALGNFLAESGTDRRSRKLAPPVASRSDMALARWLEMQLGTAVLWLADCSKFQPITPALAQQLRETFHPHLSVEQIELLYRLPGSRQSLAGIQFSHEVCCALGHLWLQRGDEARRQTVLQFLLNALDDVKPDSAASSLAMLNWEMLHERLLLEYDANGDHRRLGELLQSPLAPALLASLHGYALPAADGTVPAGKIPLASRLRHPQALLRLRSIADNPLDIGMLVKRWHRWTLGVLATSTLLLTSAGLFSAWQQPTRMPELRLAGDSSGMLLRVQAEGEQSATWKAAMRGEKQTINTGSYNLALFSGGQTAVRPDVRVNEQELLTLTVQTTENKLPCRSTVADGIEILRCAETDMQYKEATIRYPLWHDRVASDDGRQLSIGIEVSAKPAQGMRDFRATLWQSGSVDAIIHLERAELAQSEAMTQALRASGWLPGLSVQLIAWSDTTEQPIASDAGTITPIYLATFAEAGAISALLEHNQGVVVDEKALRQRQVALLNPEKGLQAGTKRMFDGMAFRWIPPGSFMMGSNDGESDEKPVHKVTIRKGFWMAETELTFDQYDVFAQATKRGLADDYGWGRGHRPAIFVSWDDAQAYVKWMKAKTGRDYRLPSEAEWEYAARAGTAGAYGFDGGEKRLGDYAWYRGNSGGKTHPVGQKKANLWGLHDMHGNVWEWVGDCVNENYEQAPSDGTAWLSGGCSWRVLRGGFWGYNPAGLRSASRDRGGAGGRDLNVGFRVVLSASAVQD